MEASSTYARSRHSLAIMNISGSIWYILIFLGYLGPRIKHNYHTSIMTSVTHSCLFQKGTRVDEVVEHLHVVEIFRRV